MVGSSVRGAFGALFLVALANLALPPAEAFADAYDDFETFAAAAFGAQRDSLILERFGPALVAPTDWWEFASESSAAIGFTTNLPAISHVEYGPTPTYGQTTPPTTRHHYQHLHHLTGLTPGQPCHYRVVLEDENGAVFEGSHRVVLPAAPPGAIRIPDDLQGPPYVLDTPGAYYLVTADIDAAWRAFEVTADSVVLDLGAHTVTYNTVEHTSIGTTWFDYRNQAAFGVRSIDPDGVGVYNGTIVQGAGQNGTHRDASVGFNPVYFWDAADLEVAGLVIEYAGDQMVGLYAHWPQPGVEVHHNVFRDRGTEVANRHGLGSAAFGIIGAHGNVQAHHNLILRTRQNGLNGGSIHDNEIYIDSFKTNSFGIPGLAGGQEASGNKIFGTGYHVVGIGWGRQNWWHDNFVHLSGQGPDGRDTEYGNQESLNGIRLTQYAAGTDDLSDSIVEDNLVIITDGDCAGTGECTQARGLQYTSDPYVVDNLIRGNTIKVVMDSVVTQAAAIVTQGSPDRFGTEAPLRYEDNVLISNVANVRISDYAGAGWNHRFYGTEFVRVGNRADYRTVRFGSGWPVQDHYFYDSRFAGGASLDLVAFVAPTQAIDVGWTLDVTVTNGTDPLDGAQVTIRDAGDLVLSAGTTGPDGRFLDQLVEYEEFQAGRTFSTPLSVVATFDAVEDTVFVDLDSTTAIQIVLPVVTAAPASSIVSGFRLRADPPVMGDHADFRWSRGLDIPARLAVYDLRGRRVRELLLPAGAAVARWDGRDESGSRVSSGVYFARLRAGGEHAVCRIVVVR